MTIQSKNDIKGTPNGDDHDAQFDPRPKWPFWIGTGGRFPSESVAAFIGMRTGCQWRALPKDLPPRSTVHDYLGLWNWDGTLDRIHHALYLKCREKAAREASPTACIIDSQSVKSAEKGGLASTATASMPAS